MWNSLGDSSHRRVLLCFYCPMFGLERKAMMIIFTFRVGKMKGPTFMTWLGRLNASKFLSVETGPIICATWLIGKIKKVISQSYSCGVLLRGNSSSKHLEALRKHPRCFRRSWEQWLSTLGASHCLGGYLTSNFGCYKLGWSAIDI